jgi:hypothetical protein
MQLIMEHLSDAKDVGKLMRGEQADSPDSHPHSKYAFRMLQQFRIGCVSDYRRYIYICLGQVSSLLSNFNPAAITTEPSKYTITTLTFKVLSKCEDEVEMLHLQPPLSSQPP